MRSGNFKPAQKLPATGTVDLSHPGHAGQRRAVVVAKQSQVSGQITMDYALPANGLTLRLYAIGFGGAAPWLATAKTAANGVYSLAYAPPAAGTNLEVRAVGATGSETVVSSIIYNAPARTALNLVAPASAQPLAPEFQRLSADVQKVIGGAGIQNLAKAQESATQRDLTLLYQSTGWDARLLADRGHGGGTGHHDGRGLGRPLCAVPVRRFQRSPNAGDDPPPPPSASRCKGPARRALSASPPRKSPPRKPLSQPLRAKFN